MIKLIVHEAIRHIETLKGHFQQQKGNCSTDVLQFVEMPQKDTTGLLAQSRLTIITAVFFSK